RDEAVAALGRIAATSSLYGEAQKAVANTLIRDTPSQPRPADLQQACATIEALALQGIERFTLVRDILGTALRLLGSGHLKPARPVTLLGHPLDDAGLRFGLENAYRNLAKLTDDTAAKVALVDLANQVRPKTFV